MSYTQGAPEKVVVQGRGELLSCSERGATFGSGARFLAKPKRSAANVAACDAVMGAIDVALGVAAGGGFGRKLLADRLGVTVPAVDHWFRTGKHELPPSRLAELLVRDDVLPRGARVAFWNELAARSGVVVCDPGEVKEDDHPVHVQLLDVSAATGRLAERVRDAVDEKGAGGTKLTAAERRELLRAAQRLVQGAAELVKTLEK